MCLNSPCVYRWACSMGLKYTACVFDGCAWKSEPNGAVRAGWAWSPFILTTLLNTRVLTWPNGTQLLCQHQWIWSTSWSFEKSCEHINSFNSAFVQYPPEAKKDQMIRSLNNNCAQRKTMTWLKSPQTPHTYVSSFRNHFFWLLASD